MTLTSVTAPLASTINISNADVTLQGLANTMALTALNIGDGGTLRLNSVVGLAVGSTISFTGSSGKLVFGTGLNIPLFGGIAGFGPGNSIDVSSAQASRIVYVDNTGNNTGGTLTLVDSGNNTISTLTLRTGEYVTTDFHLRPDGANGSLIDFDAYVTGVTTNPGSATVRATNTVNFTVATNKPVSVTGSPALTLNDGRTAVYNSSLSSSGNLVFTYTVSPGDNSTDLAVTGVSLTNGTLRATDGSGVDLAAAATINPPGTIVVDTTPPTVQSMIASQPNATLGAGASVDLTLVLNEAVTVVGGSPMLMLSDGGSASYVGPGSSANTMVFHYTVQPNQQASDLSVASLVLNGATIADQAGNPLSSTNLSSIDLPGTLVVDGVAPRASGLTAASPSAALHAGQVLNLTVQLTEPVTVTGGSGPTLTLSNGRIAQLLPTQSATSTLVFAYTVQPGDDATSLSIASANLNGATATDAAGNPLDLTTFAGQSVGGILIDTTAPTVTAVSITPNVNAVGVGQVVGIKLTLSEAIMSGAGTPQLALDDGGVAIYDPANSDATHLAFTYTVQPHQNSTNLAITGATFTGSAPTDAAGNALDLSAALSAPHPVLVVNTNGPLASTLTTDVGDGVLGAGRTVQIRIDLTEPVSVIGGSPTLTLSDGGTATYVPQPSPGTELVFTYTVQSGAHTPDLTVTAAMLNGAVIADAAGNVLSPNSLIGNPTGTLVVDAQAPTVLSAATNLGSGALHAGDSAVITLTLDKPVTVVGGPPVLTLSDGGTATFDPQASVGNVLVFDHTVLQGAQTPDLTVTAASLNGAVIADAAGNVLPLSSLLVNPAGTLSVDTQAPTVTSVTTNPGSGVLHVGDTVLITVGLSEAIVAGGGSPVLFLNDGGSAALDPAASSSTSLVFKHTVHAGDSAANLAIVGAAITGASLSDAAGNALDLSTAVINPNATLAVDTTPVTTTNPPTTTPPITTPPITTPPTATSPAPIVVGVTTTTGSAPVEAGSTFNIVITTDTPVIVANGVPTLTLSDGEVAIYDPLLSTPTKLVFSSVAPAGQAGALAIDGYNLQGATIENATGQALSLAAIQGSLSGGLTVVTPSQPTANVPVDTTSPTTPVITQPDPIPVSAGTFPADPGSAGSGDGGGQPAPTTTPTPSAAPSSLVVYRFFDSNNGTHFYTVDPQERASILASRPDLVPEGSSGVGLRAANPASGDTAAVEVFRFFDTVHGTQFLTASQTERDGLIATRPDLRFEPQGSFFEHVQPQAGDTAVYRFFSSADGTHFYTDSPTERANIIATRPDLIAEGIGFYEPK